jgi:cobalt-zinc-cadmium resistance protein CzcA
MIRLLIDFALRNRILILSVALVLFIWGIISFRNLPIEAYPDVADTYTQIITQWPGHAAEEVEQQITVPLEVTLNGVPPGCRSSPLFTTTKSPPSTRVRKCSTACSK